MVYSPTFAIKINQMRVNIPYMDPMGIEINYLSFCFRHAHVMSLQFG